MGAERIALGFSGGGTAHHCGVSHDPIMIQYARRPKRTKLQLEALALGVVAHGAVSVTVRRIARPDRNWNSELASINPVPSGHGLAQARRAILPLQFAFDLED